MATGGNFSFRDAVSSAVLGLPKVDSLTNEQYVALESFLSGNDTVTLLPTGHGKSLIYQIAPVVAGIMISRNNAPSCLEGVKKPILIVVSPLAALIRDQVEEANAMGISAVSLLDATEREARDIEQGKYQLVFGIPELWVETERWGDMLLSDHYQENLIGIVCDEVHKTPSWGMAKKGVKAFRECFGRLAELRSLCRNGIPVLALTASADVKTRKDIVHLLKLKKTTLYVEASPDRPNIRLSCVSVKKGDKSCLDWIVTGLREEGTSHPKIIIYCTSITVTRKVYDHIKKSLGDNAYVGPKQLSRYCLVAMFHNPTHAHKKEEVLACFAEGPVRVIVATTALSMGINFKDVRYVVNYGAPHSAEDMLQQIGRAGRDGLQSYGIVYHTSGDRCDDDVKAFVSCKTCLRANLYNLFEKKKATVPMLPGHICCSVCHQACCCNDDKNACIVPAPVFDKPKAPGTVPDDQPSLKRSVSDDEKQRLREGLFEYRQSLVQSKKLMFTLDMTTGFSADLIDCIIEHSPYIFDVEYIRKHIFLYDMKHADGIMAIVNKVFSEKLDMDDLLSFIQSEFCSEEADDDAERFYFWDCPFEDPPSSSSSNEESDDDDVE